MITSADQTLATTAANNDAIAATFHVFPTFLNEFKATMARLKAFALDTDPLTRELEPVARDLGPTLHSRCRSHPTATRTTAATPIRLRYGSPIRAC